MNYDDMVVGGGEVADADSPSGPGLEDVMQSAFLEYETVQKELKEIEMLIEQSISEVETLAQRNAAAANKLRAIEANLDTMPRADIQNAYRAANDAQARLFTMRGQVEQLQGKQQHLTRYRDQLHEIITTYREQLSVGPTTAGDHEDHAQNMGDSSIVNIINAQENERLHLSKQLHDGPAQSLTNLILQAEICERLFDKQPSRAKTELSNLKEAVNHTFQKIREYIFELRPMMLDDLGLAPTLRQYTREFEGKHDISCNLLISGTEHRIATHTEVTLFRVIQALLNNVADHAKATNVQVSLEFQPERITAVVTDDGSGFDVTEAEAHARERKQMGLISMREQISMLRGDIDIDSNLGQGTTVSLWLPVE